MREDLDEKEGQATSETVTHAGYMRFAPDAATRHVEDPALTDELKTLAASDDNRPRIPIWGFDATKDVNSVQNITCRVQSDECKKDLVLDNLSFVRKVDGALESSIEVEFATGKFTVPLSEKSRLATFLTMDGYNAPNRHQLWPLEAWEDCGFVHVHAFDIELITGNVTYLADLPADHRDKGEVDAFLDRCRLFESIPEDRSAQEALFKDNLWRHWGADIEGVTVLDPVGMQNLAKDLLQLRITTARVLVCCSVTLNRAFNDYAYGRPVWMGRIYPQMMVMANVPLFKLKAGISFERPSTITIEDQLPCGCGEMNNGIEANLFSDNNSGNIDSFIESVPAVTWDQIFNYHLPSAFAALRGTRIRVAKRGRHSQAAPIWISGAVIRMGDVTKDRVVRVQGQGAFDSIHVAPSMKLPRALTYAETSRGFRDFPGLMKSRELKPSDRVAWHLDDIRMAPFCAHDCFHMHWRWMNVWSDQFLAGWGGQVPNIVPGAPMVPENQDLFLEVLSPSSFLYEVETGLLGGHPSDSSTWQIICHHGAGYALDVTYKARFARVIAHSGAFGTWTYFPETVDADWAPFYWNLRYFVGDENSAPTERCVIIDLQALIDA